VQQEVSVIRSPWPYHANWECGAQEASTQCVEEGRLSQGRTAELELQLRVDQLVALQHLAQAAPLVRRLLALALGLAEGQVIVVVRLLRVVVRPDLAAAVLHTVSTRCEVQPGQAPSVQARVAAPC